MYFVSIVGAGIQPYFYDRTLRKGYYLLGKEDYSTSKGELFVWSDFGGRPEEGEITFEAVAAREGAEELLEICGEKNELLAKLRQKDISYIDQQVGMKFRSDLNAFVLKIYRLYLVQITNKEDFVCVKQETCACCVHRFDRKRAEPSFNNRKYQEKLQIRWFDIDTLFNAIYTKCQSKNDRYYAHIEAMEGDFYYKIRSCFVNTLIQSSAYFEYENNQNQKILAFDSSKSLLQKSPQSQ